MKGALHRQGKAKETEKHETGHDCNFDLGSTESTVLARMIRDMGVYSRKSHPKAMTSQRISYGTLQRKGNYFKRRRKPYCDGHAVDVNPFIYDCGCPGNCN